MRHSLLVIAALLLGGCASAGDEPAPAQSSPSSGPASPEATTPTAGASASGGVATPPDQSATPDPAPFPVSLPAYFDRSFSGGDLRLGEVRERTGAYTSYAASYRSGRLRITGVLNVPTGRGPFPAVVLAHGYIDPTIYVTGQGSKAARDARIAPIARAIFDESQTEGSGLRRSAQR